MDLTRVLDSPHALHAASAHLPIALCLLGAPLAVAAAFAPRRWTGFRVFAWMFFLLAVLAALAAASAGERAAADLSALQDEEIQSIVAQHRALAYWTIGLVCGTAVLLGPGLLLTRKTALFLRGLGVASSLGMAALVLFVGSSGGRLVYGFGIGTPVYGIDAISGGTPLVGVHPGADPEGGSAGTEPAEEVDLNDIYTPRTRPIDADQPVALDFTADVLPLLERHCTECHGTDSPESGLELSTVDGVLKGGDYAGPGVLPGDPDESPIVLHIRGIYRPKMPKDRDELSEDDLHTIRLWISAGAKAN
jgi:hypothetical protein